MAFIALRGSGACLLQANKHSISSSRRRSCATVPACRVSVDDTPDHTLSRRSTLGLLLALPASTSPLAGKAALLELENHRSAQGFMGSIDQARDSEEDQRKRFYLQGPTKLSLADHKRRAADSVARLQSPDFKRSVDKGMFNQVQADLRHQMGTLRYDLDALTASKTDKSAKRTARQLQDKAMQALEDLDYYARLQKPDKLAQSYNTAVSAVKEVVSYLG